ncbi:formyltransferase family protein [Kiloniella litopenaei]|uniref:formyltransferase family protein n=1 Tax=Kiloniella litopenaei TaxID=1549748 RepID=UPI003BAA3CFE
MNFLAEEAGLKSFAVSSLQELEEKITQGAVIVGFSTGVVVPPRILNKASRAYNFHPGTPLFPGRDPHYWAQEAKASHFGCTLHFMTPKVDAGKILGTRQFAVRNFSAEELRIRAEIEMLSLLEDNLSNLYHNQLLPNGEDWSGPTRTRSDFLGSGLEFEAEKPKRFPQMPNREKANSLFFGIRCEQDIAAALEYYKALMQEGNASSFTSKRIKFIENQIQNRAERN